MPTSSIGCAIRISLVYGLYNYICCFCSSSFMFLLFFFFWLGLGSRCPHQPLTPAFLMPPWVISKRQWNRAVLVWSPELNIMCEARGLLTGVERHSRSCRFGSKTQQMASHMHMVPRNDLSVIRVGVHIQQER